MFVFFVCKFGEINFIAFNLDLELSPHELDQVGRGDTPIGHDRRDGNFEAIFKKRKIPPRNFPFHLRNKNQQIYKIVKEYAKNIINRLVVSKTITLFYNSH
jgi:hypothetical protein